MQAASEGPPHAGIVLLGSSTFTHQKNKDNPSFGRSAAALKAALERPGAMLDQKPVFLDLFDEDHEPSQVIREIQGFVKTPGLTDIVIYYCGHGGYLSDGRTYVLDLKETEPDNGYTALRLASIQMALDKLLAGKRLFYVLDCCFAGLALHELQTVGSAMMDTVAQETVRDGVAFIAAAPHDAPAKVPAKLQLTAFTSGLVEAITKGSSTGGARLSFREVFHETARRVNELQVGAPDPILRTPRQSGADIVDNKLFGNPAYVPPASPPPTEEEKLDFQEDLRLLNQNNRPATRRAAIENLGTLYETTRSNDLKAEILKRLRMVRDDDQDAGATRNLARAKLLELEPREKAPTPPAPEKPAARGSKTDSGAKGEAGKPTLWDRIKTWLLWIAIVYGVVVIFAYIFSR